MDFTQRNGGRIRSVKQRLYRPILANGAHR